jgi:predicted O-methyltransferase YrrM
MEMLPKETGLLLRRFLAIDNLKKAFPWPDERPDVPKNDHGHFNTGHKQALSKWCPEGAIIILEIGTWLGTSARYLADLRPDAIVITVDTFEGESHHTTDKYPFLPDLKDTFITNTWEYRDRIIYIDLPSDNAFQVLASFNISPDFIYIDGDHQSPQPKEDLKNAIWLNSEAVICGDDRWRDGVIEALQGYMYVTHSQLWKLGR